MIQYCHRPTRIEGYFAITAGGSDLYLRAFRRLIVEYIGDVERIFPSIKCVGKMRFLPSYSSRNQSFSPPERIRTADLRTLSTDRLHQTPLPSIGQSRPLYTAGLLFLSYYAVVIEVDKDLFLASYTLRHCSGSEPAQTPRWGLKIPSSLLSRNASAGWQTGLFPPRP